MKAHSKNLACIMILYFLLFPPVPTFAQEVAYEEARIVAENWISFIVERDKGWGGAEKGFVKDFKALRESGTLLGFIATVEPSGYVFVAPLKNFGPINAYSLSGSFDYTQKHGMPAALYKKIMRRMNALEKKYNGIENIQSTDQGIGRDSNLQVWNFLLEGGSELQANLSSLSTGGNGKKGPLIETRWHQRPPYNNLQPNSGCSWPNQGYYNQNALVGCGPLALAQLMRYFRWPPGYDWLNMQKSYAWSDPLGQFVNEDGAPVTQTMIDATATICRHSAQSVYTLYENCENTTAALCHPSAADIRDALEDTFFYSSPDLDQPICVYREGHAVDAWWRGIVAEIDINRPMLYRIASEGAVKSDFDHVIVIDGYDGSSGQYMVSANYGWEPTAYTTWYSIDNFYCDPPCDTDEEEMVRSIYPRGGICGYFTGTLGYTADYPHYVYCDVVSYGMTIEPGAKVQFLGRSTGEKISCAGNPVSISGLPGNSTRFFSRGDSTRGMVISGGMKIYNNGGIRVY